MLKFTYTCLDEYNKENTVEMSWESDEEDIYVALDRFKSFLLGMTYNSSLVDKIIYLSDDQAAKLYLSGDEVEEK